MNNRMISADQLLDELYMASKQIDNIYQAPEVVESAKRLWAAVREDLGVDPQEILDNPEILPGLLQAYEAKRESKFVNFIMTKINSWHDILDGQRNYQFENPPVVGSVFNFRHKDGGWGHTSTIKEVFVTDGGYRIHTQNSVYDIQIQQ